MNELAFCCTCQNQHRSAPGFRCWFNPFAYDAFHGLNFTLCESCRSIWLVVQETTNCAHDDKTTAIAQFSESELLYTGLRHNAMCPECFWELLKTARELHRRTTPSTSPRAS